MQSFSGPRAEPHDPARSNPAPASFADECYGTLARLIAYVGTLALLAIVGVHFWDELPSRGVAPPIETGWSPATRSYPAFAVSQPETIEKTETYEILRHPEGGRKDTLRWGAAGEKPVAELQIYRARDQVSESGPAFAELADRMDPSGARELEAAGIIDSKFGAVTLLRLAGAAGGDAPACLGFLKRLDRPDVRLYVRISGWSCQGETLPARRAAVGCMLNRLTLLTAGNDPELAELFARAELKRGSCAPATTSAAAASWVTETENPRLRGTF